MRLTNGSYNDFVAKYEGGMSIMEIVNQGDISRRTVYRYKAYYWALDSKEKKLTNRQLDGQLKYVSYFSAVSTDDYTVVWPDGQDLCPDELYTLSV